MIIVLKIIVLLVLPLPPVRRGNGKLLIACDWTIETLLLLLLGRVV